jgi:uncharacterized membrane protein YuzA (DUF378 family)
MELYFQLFVNQIAFCLIIIGALNWGLIGVFRFNLVTYVSSHFTDITQVNRILYAIIGLAALINIFNRDFYLPHLGRAVFPCDSLEIKTPNNASIVTRVKTKPNVNVIYWASESSNDILVKNPWKAYDKYSNAGVALSDKYGVVELKVRAPVAYKIPTGSTLKPHIHYRICIGNGMLSPVKTAFLK